MTDQYSDVQFIGYAIPSIPKLLTGIVDPPGFEEGHYTGIEPAPDDILTRIALTMKAVEQAAASSAIDKSETTLKIFVMPEFSFRGKWGAYDNHPPDVDYFTYFREEFAKRVAIQDYQGWLFAGGTIVNTVNYVRGQYPKQDLKARVRESLAIALARAWRYARDNDDDELAICLSSTLRCYTTYCHNDPVFEVTDKSFVVAGGPPPPGAAYRKGLSIEKKYMSNEDFVLNLYGFAEDECGFPKICESDGENKKTAFDAFSIFTIEGIKFGLEVCLDHTGARLRNFRRPQSEQVQIQLIPSCGGQIQQWAVIAGPGGLVFNCDGEYDELKTPAQPDTTQSLWTGTDSKRAHTQLAQVQTPCGDSPPGNSNNATVTRPEATVTRLPIDDDAAAKKIFAYGAGEVHIYTKLPVPPAITG